MDVFEKRDFIINKRIIIIGIPRNSEFTE